MAEDDPPNSKGYTFYAAVAEYYDKKSDYTNAYVQFLHKNVNRHQKTPGISKIPGSATTSFNMPSHPKDNANSGDATTTKPQDQVSGTGNADTREIRKATVAEHKANPGPVMANNLPEPKSKEQLKKEAEQLNK